jgi:hypothetical protein
MRFENQELLLFFLMVYSNEKYSHFTWQMVMLLLYICLHNGALIHFVLFCMQKAIVNYVFLIPNCRFENVFPAYFGIETPNNIFI